MLLWSGAKCCTSTNAMPVSAGMWVKNVLKASRPPAEAPMPTISGNRTPGAAGVASTFRTGPAALVGPWIDLSGTAFAFAHSRAVTD